MAQQIIIKGTPVTAANEVLVADSNSKIPAVDGSLVTAMAGGNITGTIATARLDTGTTANKLVVLTGSGLPAVDGSLLTGIVSYTKSASDPTISTNPSGGVGTEWVNHTTGKQFICTDATAGANVWTCSGGGSGNVEPVKWYGPRGAWGGGHHPTRDTIDYITIATTGNAIDFGNLLSALRYVGGFSGDGRGVFIGGTPPLSNVMQYITLASVGNAIDFGDLTTAQGGMGGLSSGTRGVRIGGDLTNVIEYVTIATPGNAVDFGDTVANQNMAAGLSNGTYGLYAGGNYPNTNTMDKITVATTGNAIDWADVLNTPFDMAAVSNDTRGIWMGGFSVTAQNAYLDVIHYLTIATQGNTVDFGDLLAAAANISGVTDATKGVTAGGTPGVSNVIQYVNIATTGNAVDFGDLTFGRYTAGNASG